MRLAAIAIFALLLSLPGYAAMRPVHLRCEYLSEPVGIGESAPLLSWQLDADYNGARQTAYEIRAADSRQDLTRGQRVRWETGKVASSETAQIPYQGAELRSFARCVWQVRAWDEHDHVGPWSAPASWEMGILKPDEWQGQWIGATADTEYQPAPFLRRTCYLGKPIASARMYLCGLGYYELHCNGRRVGDHRLDPGYTRYDRRDLYITYDMRPYLREGENALGVVLGTGWENVHTRAVWYFDKAPWRAAPKVIANLRVVYSDGTIEVFPTDAHWKVSAGPIVFDSIYGGETYDARREMPGWDTVGYDDSAWTAAVAVKAPGGTLSPQVMPPIRATKELAPVKIAEPKSGVWLFDFGHGLSGHARLRVAAPAGTKIVMRYGERLHDDGTLDQSHLAQHQIKTDPPQQFQTDTYICKGSGVEAWEARFVYHGFQYVEVTGLPARPGADTLQAIFTHTDVADAGSFRCSNPLLNAIWRNTRWSYLSNLASIPTDCPHREKNGWTGDAHLAAEAGLLNYDGISVYRKWIGDLADEQRPTGELPGIVPSSGWGYEWGNGPAWDSAYLLIPWYLYEYYGDTRTLTEHYDGIKRYVDYLTTKSHDGIVSIGLGDWVPWRTETPVEVTSTGYYYRDALIVAETARLLGKAADEIHYRELAAEIARQFNARFYDPAHDTYANGSQTALSCALYQGLAPSERTGTTMAGLVRAVESHDNHIDTGILGAKYLLNTLTDHGRADLAYKIATQRTQPGWGWWIEQGATTLWESWGGTDSRNHIMFGDISAWMVKALAGINPDPASPGFRHILIQPNVVGDLTSASAHYDSVRGRIESSWTLVGDQLTLRVTVPPNCTARVEVPCEKYGKVRVSPDEEHVRNAPEHEGNRAVEIGSGRYEFRSTVTRPMAGR